MNNFSESDTKAEIIDKQLKKDGWDFENPLIKIKREYKISEGKIGDVNRKSLFADYVLIYKNQKLAIVEAKKASISYTEGVEQAKKYAKLLNVRYTYSTNGKEIYQIDMNTNEEKEVNKFLSPEKLWNITFKMDNNIFNKLSSIPYHTSEYKKLRYYQENAINEVIKAISTKKKRILLTLATGTGKTYIAFQICWKLYKAKWNKNNKFGERNPRILFLADRNILANQAEQNFSGFDKDSISRVIPKKIKQNGNIVPTAQNIFFTIFQTFMSDDGKNKYYTQYDKDFFDFIIIDECHRAGANDQSTWREILTYFSSSYQLGLTATPRRDENIDTYDYFGNPVYEYSLKQGINDGFLTPFRIRNISDNFKTYKYNEKDYIKGEIDYEKLYSENDFNNNIQLKEREIERVKFFMNEIDQNEKTIVFCASQNHAGIIRDIINQVRINKNVDNYCKRITANDGEDGEKDLLNFQDTEKSTPTILTTSRKLSTGVDAIQIKNIVILRPIKSMIEFKQIIGRGTRLCDEKEYFRIYDFENVSKLFEDKEWDGEYEEEKEVKKYNKINQKKIDKNDKKRMILVKLGNGRNVEIEDNGTQFYNKELGKPISVNDFIKILFNKLQIFFKETDINTIFSDIEKRKIFFQELENIGYSKKEFEELKEILDLKESDIYDVINYIFKGTKAISRKDKIENCKKYFSNSPYKDNDFINFLMNNYIENGEYELNKDLSDLIKVKYGTIINAINEMGTIENIQNIFNEFNKSLYCNNY